MSSQGPTFVASGVNGTGTWTTPGNVTAEDGASAVISLPGGNTGTIRCTMGANAFTVPTGATVTGVLVEIKCYGVDNFGGTITFNVVTLVNGGAQIGTNQASGSPNSGGTLTYVSFGGSSNQMGASLTPAIANSSTFGVDIAFSDSGAGPGQADIDAVRITVYYNLADAWVPASRQKALDRLMGYLIKQSTTAQPLTFMMISSTDHISAVTGITPTVTLSKNGAAFAAAAGAVSEIGNGWYEVAGNATDSATLGPLLLHATGTGADPWNDRFEVVSFDPQDAVRLGLTAMPNANAAANGGLPTVDANNAVKVQSGTGANQISLTNGLVSLASDIRSGTAQAGAAGTITLDAGASATTDFYKGALIETTGGTGAGQSRVCTAYNGTTKVATISPNWATNPDNTTTFTVKPWADVLNVALGTSGVVYPTNFSSLAITAGGAVDVGRILGTDLTQGAGGRLAANFTTFFNVSSATGTQDRIPHVTLADTITTYTGNTPQTGDCYARIGANGGGLTALGDARIANLDTTVSSRLAAASYVTPPTTAQITSAIWDEAISGHLTAGSTGAKLNSAASSADPWSVSLPGSYTAGQAGYIVGHNLDAQVSTRSSGTVPTAAQIATQVWTDLTASTDFSTANSIGALLKTNIDTNIGSRGTFSGGAVASVTGNVGGNVNGSVNSVVTGVTVTTNNDKTGYSLTQAFPTNFASMAITAGGAVTAGTVSDKTGYALSAAGLDSIDTTEATGVASSFRQKMLQVHRRFYGHSTLSATQLLVYAADGVTVQTTQAVSDTGTLQSVGAA